MEPELTSLEHIDGVVRLQQACFPQPFPADLLWKHEHIFHHIEKFPEGQFVVCDDSGNVSASATNLIITEKNWNSHANWETTVGGHFLRSHDANGSTLYGVDISVHPRWRGKGIARKLYQARFNLVKELNLIRFGTACRMPDFLSSGMAAPLQFAEAVARGAQNDRTLTPLLKCGMRLVTVVENHLDDAESGNAGAVLEWRPR